MLRWYENPDNPKEVSGHVVKMGKREYYYSTERIPTNKEHYFPTFLARDREELGEN